MEFIRDINSVSEAVTTFHEEKPGLSCWFHKEEWMTKLSRSYYSREGKQIMKVSKSMTNNLNDLHTKIVHRYLLVKNNLNHVQCTSLNFLPSQNKFVTFFTRAYQF